jgi:DnaK suppressor protein
MGHVRDRYAFGGARLLDLVRRPFSIATAGPDRSSGVMSRVMIRAALYAGPVHEDLDQLLDEREARLEAELTELTKPAGDAGTISFGKRVGEGTSMAVDRLAAVSTQEHLLTMLDEVRRARQRVAEGSYGACEVCGEPIPQGRLEARPWAVRCIAHS